jgi:7-carboxy-7-deazaguanine synthase
MIINEIFFSVQGEGKLTGIPTTFIRIAGCNLRCTYCDTKYSQEPEDGIDMTLTEIVDKVISLSPTCEWVCITGGEPLFQQELHGLVMLLKEHLYYIEIETNGSLAPPVWSDVVDCWCPDIKCPSSGMSGRHSNKWFGMREQDQIKFVVGNEADLDFVLKTMRTNKVLSPVLISPVTSATINHDGIIMWNSKWAQQCVEFVRENNLQFSLQIHKLIWGNKKGV